MAAQRAFSSRRSILELSQKFSVSPQEVRAYLKLRDSVVSLDVDEVRQLLLGGGYQYPHRSISFQMLKGGVAKTTSAYFVGKRLAQYGARVLFVDLDQQANLSYALGFESEEHPVWVDLIEGKTEIEKMLIPLDENVDLIPSNLNNSVLDRVLMRTQRNWSMCVKGPLSRIKKNYDFIIMDLAPALSVINTAATIASDQVILPVNPDKFSMVGLKKHFSELKITQEEFGCEFETKVLFTKFDAREKMSELYLKECLAHFGEHLFETYIRSSADIKNALELKKDIFAAKSGIRNDFEDLASEILHLEGVTLNLPQSEKQGVLPYA